MKKENGKFNGMNPLVMVVHKLTTPKRKFKFVWEVRLPRMEHS